ncbi:MULTISPECIES: hypothetical protein [Paracoccus]|jgi:uncharacterized membrane protein|uniref:hypothetical protein n=1 Tax=Paracoccus TaxID=265 RepID=UPI001E4ADC7C|nr:MULTISPECIES: hypothetical protein [Paracoccus]UFS66611.1 hypothetical protein LO749_19090 [Paracoccus denitrificans]
MKFRSAFAVLSMTVALAACGELPFQKSDEPEAQGHSGPPTVSPLEQPIETGTEGKPIATAEASTLSTAMFRAAGSGWTVTAADKTAVYERPGARSVGVTVRRMVYGRGVEFIGTMNGSVFALNIQAAECEAGGQKTPFTARLRVGSQRLSGCAAPTDTMPKAQVRASSAAPKPKAQPKPAAPAAKPEAAPAAEAPTTAPAAAATGATAPATATPETTAPETAAPTTTPATTPSAGSPTEGAATGTPATGTTTTDAPAAGAPSSTPAAPSPASESPAAGGSGSDTTGGVPAPALILPEPPAPSE